MDEKAKLKHLLGHWAEHNDDHADNYILWAAKAEGWGNTELGVILREIAEDNRKTAQRFKSAIDLLD